MISTTCPSIFSSLSITNRLFTRSTRSRGSRIADCTPSLYRTISEPSGLSTSGKSDDPGISAAQDSCESIIEPNKTQLFIATKASLVTSVRSPLRRLLSGDGDHREKFPPLCPDKVKFVRVKRVAVEKSPHHPRPGKSAFPSVE